MSKIHEGEVLVAVDRGDAELVCAALRGFAISVYGEEGAKQELLKPFPLLSKFEEARNNAPIMADMAEDA